jgi:hypothetical protein
MSLANSGSSPSDLTLPPKTPPPPPKLDASWDRVCACSFGHYPWDDWKRWALAQGLDAKVAGQARLLIREAFNHAWEGWLQIICGWDDDGLALFEFGRRAPEKALRQWNVLMRTDGFRGTFIPKLEHGPGVICGSMPGDCMTGCSFKLRSTRSAGSRSQNPKLTMQNPKSHAPHP